MPASQPRLDWTEADWARYHEDMLAEARARVLERAYAAADPIIDDIRRDMRARTPKRRQPLRPRGLYLSRAAVQAMHSELMRHASAGVESGGPVYGTIGDTALAIDRAEAWPDDTTQRSRGQLTFRGGDQITDPDFCGTWHSHHRRDAQPSPEDLIGAAELLDDLERSSLVLIIASYGHGGESGLARGRFDLGAWLVQRDPHGQTTYEAMGGV